MPFATNQFNVAGTATLIVDPKTASASDPMPAVIFNNDTTNTVFFGGPGVTAVSGFPILKQTGISFRLISGEQIFAITLGPTVDTRVLIGRS